jgi:hypothetical protein
VISSVVHTYTRKHSAEEIDATVSPELVIRASWAPIKIAPQEN